jgi:hypothetical protein
MTLWQQRSAFGHWAWSKESATQMKPPVAVDCVDFCSRNPEDMCDSLSL